MHRSLLAFLLPIFALAFAPAHAAGEPSAALLSDLEGDIARFQRFLAEHPAFEKGPDGRYHLRHESVFVYGGDVPDRFFGERALLRELLRLKAEAPERVLLVAGNRDVNKLRLPLELSSQALAMPPRNKAKDYAAWCRKNACLDTATSRLRWILGQTMGSPDAFELRRRELASEAAVESARIDDTMVVESYLADAGPGGLFHQYLRAARLSARLGSTLFVHAGIPQSALGRIPGQSDQARSLQDWTMQLDDWYQTQLQAWETGCTTWDGHGDRPGDALMRYVERWGTQAANPFSIAYGRTVDEEGKVALPPEPVITWLRKQGIDRLVVGHTPSGQVPVILRTVDGSFEQLVLDTSYGLKDEIPLVALEGKAWNTTSIKALIQIDDGSRIPVTIRLPLGKISPIGRSLPDNALVIAPFGDRWLTYRLGPGYTVRYESRSADTLHE